MFSKCTAVLMKTSSWDKVYGWLIQDHLGLDNLIFRTSITAINNYSTCCIGRSLGRHLSIYD